MRNIAIAYAYWRSICRGSRSIDQVPPQMQDAVREVAQTELEAGSISREEYNTRLGLEDELVSELDTATDEEVIV